MRSNPGNPWYGRALFFAWTVFGSILILVLASVVPFLIAGGRVEGGQQLSLPALAVGVSACTLIVSTLGTASSVILGWRGERRQAAEWKLKIQQLELELAAAKAAGRSEAEQRS
jgi:hypothetical protein